MHVRAAADAVGTSSENGAPSSGVSARAELILACALFLAVGAAMLTWYPVNHDTAWLLHVAQRWLGGARLYIDVIEVNPPLIIMLLTPVAAVAYLLDRWIVSVFYAAVLGLSALSLWLAGRIVLRIMSAETAAFLIIGVAAVHLFLPGIEFGQREHLMLLFTIPYLFSVAAHGVARPSRPEGLLTGALAGIGFGLKPHFLLVLAACEAYLLIRERKWTIARAEFGAIIGVGLAYAAVLVVLTPSYIDVARWASRVYGDYMPSSWRLIAAEPGFSFAGITLIAAFATRRWGGAHIRGVFSIAAAVFVVIVFIQNKNFDYHWLPVYAATAIVWTSLAIESVREGAARIGFPPPTQRIPARRLILASICSVLIGVGLVSGRSDSAEAWSRVGGYPAVLSVIEDQEGARSWFAFSANMLSGFPLVMYADLEWTAPFNSLWPVVGLYDETAPMTKNFPYRSREEMGPTELVMFDATLHALLRDPPSLILVDGNPPGGKLHGFDFLEYFSADERFTHFMADYVVIAAIGPFHILRRRAS